MCVGCSTTTVLPPPTPCLRVCMCACVFSLVAWGLGVDRGPCAVWPSRLGFPAPPTHSPLSPPPLTPTLSCCPTLPPPWRDVRLCLHVAVWRLFGVAQPGPSASGRTSCRGRPLFRPWRVCYCGVVYALSVSFPAVVAPPCVFFLFSLPTLLTVVYLSLSSSRHRLALSPPQRCEWANVCTRYSSARQFPRR